jgi:predicted kinase
MVQASTYDAAHERVRALAAELAAADGEAPRLVETPISWVLLARSLAYKIKKPVRLPFLDFTSLAARRRFCDEELRLNRRFAPSLYLDVVEVRDAPDGASLGGSGRVVDVAVRMRRFADGALWSERVASGALRRRDIAAFAVRLAAVHRVAAVAPADGAFGTAAAHARVAKGSIAAIDAWQRGRGAAFASGRRSHRGSKPSAIGSRRTGRRASRAAASASATATFTSQTSSSSTTGRRPSMRSSSIRRCAGSIRSTTPRFSRWTCSRTAAATSRSASSIATSSERRARRASGAALLPRLAGARPRPGERARRSARHRGAERLRRRRLPARRRRDRGRHRCAPRDHARAAGIGQELRLERLLQEAGALRVRSDVERKRLFGLAPLQSSRDLVPERIYGQAATRQTYAHLRDVAELALRAGWPTIVDAAFLRRDERTTFAALATGLAAPFAILDCRAALGLLRERVRTREAEGDDPSEADVAVLDRLVAADEPLGADETARAIVVDAATPEPIAEIAKRWRAMR